MSWWSGANAQAQSFTFGPSVSRQCAPDHYPTRVVATDVDGDGNVDLLIPGRNANGIINWVPLSALGVPGVMQEMACTGQTDAVVVGDLNADALPDLAFAVRAFRGRVAVYLRGAQGLPANAMEFGLGRQPHSLAAGDWNGDGHTDLASLQYGSNELHVLQNNGAGVFSTAQRLQVEPWSGAGASPQELLVGDLNGDGRPDLVGTSISTRRVNVFFTRADGVIEPPVAWETIPMASDARPAITTAALGDVDGDGDIDIVATIISIGETQPVLVFVNDGHGGFAQRVMFPGPSQGLGWGTALGDLDGDGDLDLVTGTALPGGLFVWENTTPPGATVQFAPPQQIGTGTFTRDICIANVDGDCDMDIAYVEMGNHTVRVYRQLRECGGTFAPLMAAARASGATAAIGGPSERGSGGHVDEGYADGGAALGRAYAARVKDAGELAMLLASFGTPPLEAGAIALLQGDGSGFCGPAGPGGRCDEVHATPGCFTTPCCEMVCAFDPLCCEIGWTSSCVEIARQTCDGLVCPQYGPCDEVHADPGCEDPACCERITRIDGYCEDALWDHLCAHKSMLLCGLPPCTLDGSPNAVDEDEPCYRRLNDGPNIVSLATLTPACGATVTGACSTGTPRDSDWYLLPGAGPRRVQFTVRAEFPCEVHLIAGAFSGPLRQAAVVYGGQCAPVTLDAHLTDDGPWHAVVTLGSAAEAIRRGQPCLDENPANPWPPDYTPTPGYDGSRYEATITCIRLADFNSDGTVNGADLGALLAAWSLTGPRPEDLNGDGIVNGADLGALLADWG